ncbi:MAG: ATP synthase F1 subunit epsilon [Proteobacteria bacterium]|nr:MAG: ATP synthase F1 subunit epsilon [Pseudomonadota bacterium]
MRLRVVTPEGEKVDTDVTAVTAPGSLGELGILAGHRPLLTSLDVGKFTYVDGTATRFLATTSGYMEVHEDQITVVTETAEAPDEIDVRRAQKSLDKAERLLAETDPKTQKRAYDNALGRKKRALNRVKVAESHATPEALKEMQKRAAAS